MPAQHPQRDPPAGFRQAHSAVRRVLGQAELVEALDHRRRRPGRHVEPLGELVVAHSLARAKLECVDRLRVVLHDRRALGKF